MTIRDYNLICPPVRRDAPVRLLIIEDDPAAQDLYRAYLEADTENTYDIAAVSEAAQGAQLLGEREFDCILLDYFLPTGNGLTFLDSLYSNANGDLIPVILITGHADADVAVTCMQRGVDFMPKQNVSTNSLRRAIANAVEKATLKQTIDKQNRSLREANEQLRKSNDEIRRFYHAVSHEIKTPLTAAREFVALVNDGVLGEVNEAQREALGNAIESCDQITIHFNDLVDCARLDNEKLRLRMEKESIRKSIMLAVTGSAPGARARNVKIIQDLEAGLPSLEMDSGRMAQVASNLLNNAIKYSEPGDEVRIFARAADRGAVVEFGVTDNGPGIKAEDLPRIFDRLFQAESRDDELSGAGLGLGLSIAQEIVRLHGGEVNVDSEPGKGSTFTVRLPVRRAEQRNNTEVEIA